MAHHNWRLVGYAPCLALLLAGLAAAAPPTPAQRAQLAAGQPLSVIVEYNSTAIHLAAIAERTRRRLAFEDAPILAARTRGYAQIKASVAAAVAGADATVDSDFTNLPMAAWRLSSAAALARLEQQPQVVRVHANPVLRAVGVSDLGFIHQPQAIATGATGAGTTVAVIDGGVGTNYLAYSDFGTCTAVGTPASTCRLAYNHAYFPNQSGATAHGTNVSAIALGVAPGSRLAMLDVFNGTTASGSTVLSAMNTILAIRAQYNIVALNLSLGAGSSNSSPCAASVFATAVADLAAAGIQTVAAAGNTGSKSGLDEPGCVPGVVSVGAVYDQNYGPRGWQAPAQPGGTCTDSSAPDVVTCFSQSAAYLTVLAPGAFVNAPDASFQMSGTSQATPHVTGTIAILRARYPSESLNQLVQRVRLGGTTVLDAASQVATPRLDAYNALTLGTALALTGNGPTGSIAGTNSDFFLTATNNGPLVATNGHVDFAIPAGAQFVSASAGCALAGSTVTCSFASLAAGSMLAYTITLHWNSTGPISTSASIAADQNNSSPQQQVAWFGTPANVGDGGDAPLPPWTWVVMGLLLLLIAQTRLSAQTRRATGRPFVATFPREAA